jgi:hypothetical protein
MKVTAALLAVMSLFSATVSAKTVVYACQYTKSVGFKYKSSEWSPTNYKVGKPFFLRFTDGSIEYASVGIQLRGHEENPFNVFSWLKCPYTGKEMHVCLDDQGRSLAFNTESLEGAISDIVGIAIPKELVEIRPDLALATFTCAKM